MRIAVSGSHATGKSTLVAELVRRRPDVTAFDEPYHNLGAAHRGLRPLPGRLPGIPGGTSPAAISPDRTGEAAVALQTLDLVIFVPLERPDRIDMAEAPRLRRRVDRILREMFVENAWGFDMPVVTVHGAPGERADQVVSFLGVRHAGRNRPSRAARAASTLNPGITRHRCTECVDVSR